MSIAENIKHARLLVGITQEELSRRIGVTKGAIANYENGVSVPKIELLYALMRELNVDANYIFGVPADLSMMKLSDHERLVLLAYRSNLAMQFPVDRLLGLEEAKIENAPHAFGVKGA